MDGVEDKDTFDEAKERFEKTLDYYSDRHEEGDEDVNFALGDQWDQKERKRRQDACRPALTENHCMPFVEQLVNSAREMRPAIKVSPVDDKGDKDTAEIRKGLIRNIERKSKASVAYDMGVQNAVMAGCGWITVDVDYVDPMSFDQEIRIDSVLDWKSCMLDPTAQMVDGSDAEFGFKYTDIDEEVFEQKWPDKTVEGIEGDGWIQESSDERKVRVVDYYYREYKDETIYECFLIDGTSQVLTKAQKEQLEELGAVKAVLQERKTKVPTIKACKFYGGGELEKTDWLGKYIPIVPVYGKLVWHEGKLKSYSLIKQAKDPQMMLNIVKTTIAEIIASQPKSQPTVGPVGSFASDQRWANANVENYATLEYDPVIVHDEVTGQPMMAPPPQKQVPMQVSPGLFQVEMNAQMGIKAALGMYEEGKGEESNAISGVAIRSRQIRGDKATFHFIDNLACSIRHVGIIINDLLPKVYNRRQIKRIIGNDDKEKTVTIDPKAQTDKAQNIFNLSDGEYDVDVDVGPSYATQQQEFLDISKELIAVNPDYAAIAGDKIIEAAGGPYADVIAERIRANNPALSSEDPMAVKVVELMKQLEASKKETESALIALDTKKKNEAFDNQIQAGELKVKQSEAETKRLKTLAEIEEMRLRSQGAESEALADLSEAILEIGSKLDAVLSKTGEHEQVFNLLLSNAEQAVPPEGNPAA